MRFPEFKNFWLAVWSSVFGQTRLSRVSDGASTLDTVRMPDTAIDLTRLEQFGDVVLPPADSNCIIWRMGDGGVVMSLGVPNLRPSDCKLGDRALYCSQAGAVVKLHGANSSTPGVIELKQASGARVAITQGGDIKLTDASGHSATLSDGTLTVEDFVSAQHFMGRGSPPTVTPGLGLGGGSAFILPGASDAAFTIQMNVSMGPPDTLATVNFNKNYGSTPQGIGMCAIGAAAADTTQFIGGSFNVIPARNQLQISSTVTSGPSGGLPDGSYTLSFVILR